MRIIIALACIFTVGCGGRVARPVEASHPFDAQLSCSLIEGEYGANRQRVADLVGESDAKVRDNMGMLLVSPLFLDLGNAVQKELRAIAVRDAELQRLAKAKGCAPLGAQSPAAG